MAEDIIRPSVADLFGDDEDDEDFEPPPKRQALSPVGEDEYTEEPAEPTEEGEANAAPQADQLEEGEDAEDRVETADDRAFIDDTDAHPDEQYGSDNEQGVYYEEAEEHAPDELDQIFAKGKKKKVQRSQEDMRRQVDNFVAKLESAAELDMEAHSERKPAIHKLKMVPDVEEMVGHKALHAFFLEAGGLGALHSWLEPYERGGLPNSKVRHAVLKLLKQLPIDLGEPRTKDQMRESGIGKNVFFLFKLPEETTTNRQLAKELVHSWSRGLFHDPDRVPDTSERLQQTEEARRRRRAMEQEQQAASASANVGAEDDEFGQGRRQAVKPGDAGFRWHASIPQAARMDYTRRPQSQVTLEAGSQRKAKADKMTKHMQQLARKGKAGPAKMSQVSIQGRGLGV